MSQKLRDLVRGQVGTADGATFIEKCLSPSAPLGPQKVPDENSEPTVALGTNTSFSFTPAYFGKVVGSGAGNVKDGSPIRYAILTAPVAGLAAFAVMYYYDGATGAAAFTDMIITESDPMMQTLLNSTSSGTRYRMTASSVTATLDATAMTNSGTVYATNVGNSYSRGSTIMTGASTYKPQVYWYGSKFCSVSSSEKCLSQIIDISQDFNAVKWPMTDGIYMIQRNGGNFEFSRADQCTVQNPNGTGTTGGSINSIPLWEPCYDWNMHVAVFDNINAGAAVQVKVLKAYEIIPELGSAIMNLKEVSSTDLPAISTYKGLSRNFGQFYPADFNDWGSLWQGVKGFFSQAKPLLSKAANFIPGVGPVVSKVIDAIPVQSKESQIKAAEEAKERANNAALLEAAELKRAQATLSKGAPARKPGQSRLQYEYAKMSDRASPKKKSKAQIERELAMLERLKLQAAKRQGK